MSYRSRGSSQRRRDAAEYELETNVSHVNLDTLTSDLNLRGNEISIEHGDVDPRGHQHRGYYSAAAAAMREVADDARSNVSSSNLSSYFHEDMPPGALKHSASGSCSPSSPGPGAHAQEEGAGAAGGGGAEMTMVWFEGEATGSRGSKGSRGSRGSGGGWDRRVGAADNRDEREGSNSSSSSAARHSSSSSHRRRDRDLEKIEEQDGAGSLASRSVGSSSRGSRSSHSHSRSYGSSHASGSVSRGGRSGGGHSGRSASSHRSASNIARPEMQRRQRSVIGLHRKNPSQQNVLDESDDGLRNEVGRLGNVEADLREDLELADRVSSPAPSPRALRGGGKVYNEATGEWEDADADYDEYAEEDGQVPVIREYDEAVGHGDDGEGVEDEDLLESWPDNNSAQHRHAPQSHRHLGVLDDTDSRGSDNSETADDDDDDNEAMLALAGAATATATASAALQASRNGGSKRDMGQEPDGAGVGEAAAASRPTLSAKEDMDAWLQSSTFALRQSKQLRAQEPDSKSNVLKEDRDRESDGDDRSGAGAAAAMAVAGAATVTTAAALSAQQPEADEAAYGQQQADYYQGGQGFEAGFHDEPQEGGEMRRQGLDDDLDDWGLDPRGQSVVSRGQASVSTDAFDNRGDEFSRQSQMTNEQAFAMQDGGSLAESLATSYWQNANRQEGDGSQAYGKSYDNNDLEKSHNKAISKRAKIKKAFIAGWVLVIILVIASVSVAVSSKRSGKVVDPSTPPPNGQPTTAPIPEPTLAPIAEPTPAPIAEPTPSPAPPPSPLPSERSADIIAKAASISGDGVVNDPTTPQHDAMQWMITDDPLQLEADDLNFVQRYTLATLLFATDGDQSWEKCGPNPSPCPTEEERFLSGDSECNWHGIACRGSFVTQVSIRDNGLIGSLVPELGELQSLEVLSLGRNELESTIPSALGDISTLEQLNLERNNLGGKIPTTFGGLTSLQSLDLGRNAITGSLPSQIFTKDLNILNLSGNRLTGTIPETELLASADLFRLDLSSNQLTGPIPAELGRLSKLDFIKLSNNRLSGELSGEVFTPALKTFDIEINRVEGVIPDEIFQASSLTQLNLGKNRLSGTISKRFGELVNLELLLFFLNELSGTMPASIGGLTQLVVLDIGYNDMSGFMPEQICELLEYKLVYLASDCAKSDEGDPLGFECDCCTQCYPAL